MELKEVYRVNINGTSVDIPKTPPKATQHDDKIILEQTTDMTEVFKLLAREEASKEKVRVEMGAGVGVHKDDWYVPVAIKRNFNPHKTLELELHMATKELGKVSGGEIKYYRKLW